MKDILGSEDILALQKAIWRLRLSFRVIVKDEGYEMYYVREGPWQV